MKLTDLTVAEFVAALQSPSPTPGGGSASALAGALGAALLSMIASMPKHRATSDEDEQRLRAAGQRCSEGADRLRELVNRDSEAYEQVMAAYRLPKASDADRAERSARIQDALKTAIDAPLDIVGASVGALEQSARVAALGNPNAASDAGVALELLGAAVRGAALNVQINLASIKDARYAEDVRKQLSAQLGECEAAILAARTQLADR
jgi:methenyltetrahydrofolate cyclohydrolase